MKYMFFLLHNTFIPIKGRRACYYFTTFVPENKTTVAVWILERDIYMK